MGEGTVLVRLSSLGDVVLLGAVTAALPGPVTVVTSPGLVPLVQRLVGVDRAIAWRRGDPPPAIAGTWFDLHDTRHTRHLPVRARIRKHNPRRRLRLLRLPLAPRPSIPALYAETVGVVAQRPPWIRLAPAPRDTLVLIPGASRRFKEARGLGALVARWPGPVVALGGPDDAAPCAPLVAAGATRLLERGFTATLDVLARARVAVGGDTGLTHLAIACGVPTVGVFASTHPSDGYMPYAAAVVQRTDLWCRPCSLHGRDRCPIGSGACLDVDVARIQEAVDRCAS